MKYRVYLASVACFGTVFLGKLCAQISWPGDHVFGGNLQVGTTGTTGTVSVYGGTGSGAMPALSLSGHGGIKYQDVYLGSTSGYSGHSTLFRWKSNTGSLAVGNLQTVAGDFSLAVGIAAEANGACSFASGQLVSAEAPYSVALGVGSRALESYSIAAGDWNFAWSYYSVALGSESSSSGSYSMVMGYNSASAGDFSFTVGSLSTAMGQHSIAFGSNALSFEEGAVAVGKSTAALGLYSMAFGRNTLAEDDLSVVIGEYNAPVGYGGHVAFVIGNGQDDDHKSNALTVWKNGNVKFTGAVELPRQGDILMGEFGN